MKLIAYKHAFTITLYQTKFSKYGPRKFDTIKAVTRDFGRKTIEAIPTFILSVFLYVLTFGYFIFPSLWRFKREKIPHTFNYEIMREWDDTITPKGKQMRSIWQIPLTPKIEKKHGKHPTQKPLELLRRIICSSTNENEVILDPFSGSGTTGVIAKELNRKYIGIEKEEKLPIEDNL